MTRKGKRVLPRRDKKVKLLTNDQTTHSVSISVTHEEKIRLQALAEIHGTSQSVMARSILMPALANALLGDTEVKQSLTFDQKKAIAQVKKDIEFNRDTVDAICNRMLDPDMAGLPRTLTSVCGDPDMPYLSRVLKWMEEDSAIGRVFNQELLRARRYQANLMADWFIAKLGDVGRDTVHETRVLLDAFKFLLGRMNREDWGEKVETSHKEERHIEMVFKIEGGGEPPHLLEAEVVKEEKDDN